MTNINLEKMNLNVFDNLRTGDLILFSTNEGIIDSLLKYFTNSIYTHVGFVVKEKEIGCQKLDPNITYLWESCYENFPDPLDSKIKFGVRFTNLKELIAGFKGNLYVRKLDCSDLESKRIFNTKILGGLHSRVYGKPYDYNLIDWLACYKRYDFKPQKIDRFWCSAFVSYIYTTCGILDPKTDWSIARPSDFSKEDKDSHLEYNSNIRLENKQYLLF